MTRSRAPVHRSSVCAVLIVAAASIIFARAPHVQVLPHPIAPRVDVVIGSQPFTSYLYLTGMARPALIGLRAPSGVAIGGSEETAEADDPAGFWFAHGNVNGIDFTSSAAPRSAQAPRIVHRRVVEAVSSDGVGRLAVQSAWTAADRSVVLLEDTYFTFAGTDEHRTIERVTRLAAINGAVRLGSTRRAVAGVRLAGGVIEREAVAVGVKGETVPSPCAGTRAQSIALPISRDGQRLTVTLSDDAGNPGYPNELRCSVTGIELLPSADTSIPAGSSVTFRVRLGVTPTRSRPPPSALAQHDRRIGA